MRYTVMTSLFFFFFFSSRRRHTRLQGDWSSDVCSSDLSTPLRRAVSSGLFSLGFVKSGILRSSPINFNRNARGSAPAAVASSSTKLSTTKPLLECSTERSEEHTSELQSPCNLVCRLLLEK